jgi:predicted transcriptional regulator
MTVEAGTGKQGRPRPQDTIERDEKVYAALLASGKPATRDQIAEMSGIKPSFAYLSLIRLRDAGAVRRSTAEDEGAGSHAWVALPR